MNLIVAVDENWAIGKENSLLYYLPEDLKFFKEKTSGNVIVCGRKTLESFPGSKPLPNRIHLVLSRDFHENAENLYFFRTKEELLKKAAEFPPDSVYLCGGESMYRLFLEDCEKAFVTKIQAKTPSATAFFPDLDQDPLFSLSEKGDPLESRTGLHYSFTTYMKKRP